MGDSTGRLDVCHDGNVRKNSKVDRRGYSPDGELWTLERVIGRDGPTGKVRITCGAFSGPDIDQIAGEIDFAPDGRTPFYRASNSEGAKRGQQAIVGDKPSDIYGEIRDLLPSGRKARFFFRNGSQWTFHDGREGPSFDAVIRVQPSPDRSRMAYVAKKGDKVVAMDERNRISPETEDVIWLGFARGNWHASIREKGSVRLASSGSAGEAFDEIRIAGFAPDGELWALARKGQSNWILAGKRKVQEVKTGVAIQNGAAFIADNGDKTYSIILPGGVKGPFRKISPVAWTPAGAAAGWGDTGSQVQIHVGASMVHACREVLDLRCAPDGRAVHALARGDAGIALLKFEVKP